MELKKGTLLQGGKYKIENTLGQGSFGITYLATARFMAEGGLGKIDVVAKVAIKEFFMNEVNARNEDGSTVEGSIGIVFANYRRKFKKEAQNLAKLSHSNIVRVFDVFDENKTSYYVMEYIEGQTLDEYIKSMGRLQEEEVIKIIREVGDALSYMHSKKMLHLDLKPKNIMHRTDSSNVLIDFGLSKQYSENGEPESSTSIGLGTPGYAPLEQAQYTQDGTFPETLDVYALGATMFKMLTGKRPPEGTSILNNGFPYKELRDCEISEETISALSKSMNPIKKDRWSTVKSFVDYLPVNDEEVSVIDASVFEEKQSIVDSNSTLHLFPHNSLVGIWNSRHILTNLACVAMMFITLVTINYISAYANYNSEIILSLGFISVLSGLVAIMYGKKSFLFVPLIVLTIFELCYGWCWESMYSICISLGYLVVIGSLYLKNKGKRAITLMKCTYPDEKIKKNKVVPYFTYFATGILLIAIVCLYTNLHIDYYRFGFIELCEVLFCAILIILNLRMGIFLIPLIILLGYYRDEYTFCNSSYNYIVENCITIFYLIELWVIFFTKKDGKTVWAVMK